MGGGSNVRCNEMSGARLISALAILLSGQLQTGQFQHGYGHGGKAGQRVDGPNDVEENAAGLTGVLLHQESRKLDKGKYWRHREQEQAVGPKGFLTTDTGNT